MFDLLLATTILCELAAAAAVVLSIRFPARRIWPPDRQDSWKVYLMGSLFLYPALGIGVLGLLDLGGWGFPDWARIGLGLPPLIGGLAFFLWAESILGFGQMMGRGGALAAGGPFRISRNPQYVGCLAMLAGWILLSSSPAAATASFFAIIPLILAPFAEEPWLRARYGPAYDEYYSQVPRFL
jgi:protein-S-isoprenylcysteine O-methyltransferase Ste14